MIVRCPIGNTGRKETTMKKYYIEYPRNFANEYAIYSVETKEEQAAIARKLDRSNRDPDSDVHRIARRDAYRLTARNRQKYRTGEANHNHPAGATSITPMAEIL
jgi:hypothetical protein